MRYKNVLGRRTFLRGAAGAAIALPFLDAMHTSSVWGAPGDAPERCVTLFFGLGVPKAMQQEGFTNDGPLKPLEPFADKLTMFRNVDMSEARGQGHPPGGTCVFVGEGSDSKERATGASIDQVMRQRLDLGPEPPPIGTLAVGSFFRRAHGLYQRIRCWSADGSKAVEPIESPAETFQRVFGSFQGGDPMMGEGREKRLRRSVLDAVIGEYRHYTGERAGLGAKSVARLKEHLERIREVEKRLYDEEVLAGCMVPEMRAEPDLQYGFSGATEENAIKVDASAFQAAYRLNAEIYVLALRCDLVRFGNIMFESSGGHTAFIGEYEGPGHTYQFRSAASDHNNWHQNRQYDMRWHAHFFQSNIAYTLSLFDDASYTEANGKTLLENTMLVIGTETGTNHNMDGVFHALAGGNGHLRLPGGFYDDRVHAVDLYNTCIHAYGINETMGSQQHAEGDLTAFIA